jgi:hypothetical protein
MRAVGKHFAYLSRKGDLAIETADGQEILGKGSDSVRHRDRYSKLGLRHWAWSLIGDLPQSR